MTRRGSGYARDGVASEPDGLRALDGAGTHALRRAVTRAAAGEGATVRLLRPAGRPLAAHVFPVRGETAVNLGIAGPAAGALITDPDETPRMDPAAVALVLGLTAKEASLAVALARGATVAEAARAEGASPAALRKRLYRLFEKLGVRRQNDLVRLVSGIAQP